MTTLVAGIGNVFLGDDGFGVEVAQRLASTVNIPGDVRIIDTGIRVRDLAYELCGSAYARAILVDAVSRGGPPGTVYLIDPEVDRDPAPPGTVPDGHAMDVGAVFGFLRALGGTPPPILIVGCEPECMDEGMGLSAPVSAAVAEALALIRDLLRHEKLPGATAECV